MRTVLTIVASNSGSRTHKEIIGTDLQFQGSVTAEVTAKGGKTGLPFLPGRGSIRDTWLSVKVSGMEKGR